MKRQNLILMIIGILLCLAQTGCHDFSYQGTVYVGELDHDIPYPVWMSVGGSAGDIPMKGTGLIGGAADFQERPFYVYAFHRGSDAMFGTLASDDALSCLVDASLDVPGSRLGRKALLDRNNGYAMWASGAGPVYYPSGDHAGHVYDFFAYYIDDMELTDNNVHRYDDSAVLDVEIDGSQDLMSAKAALTEEQFADIEDMKISSDEKFLAEKRAYSYLAARKYNIHPIYTFKRHLAKFDFRFVPGLTPGQTKDVKVEKVEINSRYKGEFTVADNLKQSNLGIVFSEERRDLVLTEPDGSPFVPFMVTTDSDGSIQDMEWWTSSSLLVAPDTEYELTVTLSETRANGGESYPTRATLKLDSGVFEAANEYIVTLHVFGYMDVFISAEVGEWKDAYDGIEIPGQDIRPGQ